MRKSFALFLVLLVFVIGGTCYVSASLLREKDNVQITETVIYGDKSFVEGVTIERNVKYDNHMRWNTTYVIGEEPSCETVYTFSEGGTLREESIHRPEGINMHTDAIGEFDGSDGKNLTGVDKAMKELFDKTEPGQENSAVINLADYLDFYEYEIYIDLPGDIHHYYISRGDIEEDFHRYSANESYQKELEEQLHLIDTLTEFFKIPVIKNHFYEISVAKNMDGTLHGWGYGSANGGGSSGNVTMGATLDDADSFGLWMISTFAEDMCYFTFDPYTRNGELVDTGYIPGGYGIYGLPFDAEKKTIDVDGMRMLYELEPTEVVYGLQFDEQRNQLLLFQEKEAGSVMTVIEKDTMQKKQEIVYSKEGYSTMAYLEEEYIFLGYEDRISIFSVDEDGYYHEELECDLAPLYELTGIGFLDYSYDAFDWNGESFLITGPLNDSESYRYYQSCGFYVAAFDQTGLVYYGEYESSLDAESSYCTGYYNTGYYGYDYTCRPTENDPITISW